MFSYKPSFVPGPCSRGSTKKLKSKPPSKTGHPKKVLYSKKVSSNSISDGKSCSTSIISEGKKHLKQKKSKSEQFTNNQSRSNVCSKCKGDIKIDSTKNSMESNYCLLPSRVNQYYKNENYRPSSESVKHTILNMKKLSLNTINESTEKSEDTIYNICSESSSEDESIKDVKEFRQKNYFECHSARFRVKHKGRATTLGDHRCVYRFYLNSRLFPVPLCTDHNGVPRCVECHLPMSLAKGDDAGINGTIQAKVTMGEKKHDSTILLPIKPPLIVAQKQEEQPNDIMYFGIINLDMQGTTNPSYPVNSLALKYQNGYKEFMKRDEYVLNQLEQSDLIII